jgi:SecD/SecF fusion protein
MEISNFFVTASAAILQAANPQAGGAAPAQEAGGFFSNPIYLSMALIVLGIPLATWLGRVFGSMFKSPEISWRIGVVLWCILVSAIVVAIKPIRYGVDLRGGVLITGQFNEQKVAPGESPIEIQTQLPTLKQRIDPSSTREITIRALDQDKIEVVIPDVDDVEAKRLWKRLTDAGQLWFRIVADSNNPAHNALITAARQNAPNRRSDVFVGDKKAGEWFLLAREQPPEGVRLGRPAPFKFVPTTSHLLRNAQTGELLDISGLRFDFNNDDVARRQLSDWCEKQGLRDVEILMVHPSREQEDVEGKFLQKVARGMDEQANPRIDFTLSAEGGRRLYALTMKNKPSGGRYSLLGIVLDGQLQSAPRINEPIRARGVIEGRFTNEEIEDYKAVLSSGKLDVALRKNWISLDQVQSTLGEELKTKGFVALGISLAIVVLFMLYYYRFCGLVSVIALLLNLLFSLALLLMINVNLTLTGLAGFVLTIGMSVDAGILIFERMREERDRGAALRMAIRNGFDRATTTIVDSNLTTLITAIILYAIGTEQLRSFAVTLVIGILMCMFTGIFCSRIIFTLAERNRWISDVRMKKIFPGHIVDFMGMSRTAIAISVLLIAIGMVAVFVRGKGILDSDLAGGSTARVMLTSALPVDEIREKLEKANYMYLDEPVRYEITRMRKDERDIKIDSNLPVIEDAEAGDGLTLESIVRKVFDGQLEMLSMDYDPSTLRLENPDGTPVPTGVAPGTENLAPTGGPNAVDFGSYERRLPVWRSHESPSGLFAKMPEYQEGETGETNKQDEADKQESGEQKEAGEQQPETPPAADDLKAPSAGSESTPAPELPVIGQETAPAGARQGGVELLTAKQELKFKFAITGDAVAGYLVDAAMALGDVELQENDITLVGEGANDNRDRSEKWTVSFPVVAAGDAQRVFDKVRETMASQPYFAASSGVGGQIAGRTQWQALGAIFASCLGIIAYVWIRFQNVAFGLAAIVALIHDVLVTIGAIALSYWIAGALGFLMVDEFRISLTVIAALLTVIGYSINDTIVIFDRIREVRGKRSEITVAMANESLSKTLSRTILTSLTTLFVIIILYFLGGESIHAFAFALVIGIVSGTYSTLFIATPILLWLIGRGIAPPPVATEKTAG